MVPGSINPGPPCNDWPISKPFTHKPSIMSAMAGNKKWTLTKESVREQQPKPLFERSATCTHSDQERQLQGTWCTLEIELAMKMNYHLIHIHEVWHFSEEEEALVQAMDRQSVQAEQFGGCPGTSLPVPHGARRPKKTLAQHRGPRPVPHRVTAGQRSGTRTTFTETKPWKRWNWPVKRGRRCQTVAWFLRGAYALGDSHVLIVKRIACFCNYVIM